jgi:hypothetical protein
MKDYMAGMVDNFSMKFTAKDIVHDAASGELWAEGDATELDQKQREEFHTMVAKGLFACKRTRPDIHLMISHLCTRVRNSNEGDWKKLVHLLKFINGTRDDVLTLSADNLNVIKWLVDASFAVHPDFKSHTGAVMTYGPMAKEPSRRFQGSRSSSNTRSSTEAELVGVDNASTLILWTKLFMEAQGYNIDQNIIFQDNKSAILLEMNGKKSSTKCTCALNIRYFFMADQVEKRGPVEGSVTRDPGLACV